MQDVYIQTAALPLWDGQGFGNETMGTCMSLFKSVFVLVFCVSLPTSFT